jgi:hypothetical protein
MVILRHCLANHSNEARVFPSTSALSKWRFDACFAETVREVMTDSVCSQQKPVELDACNPVMAPNCYRPGAESCGIRFLRRTGSQ